MLAWGNNNAGQLGNGTTTSSDKPVGVKVPSGDKIKSVAEGCFHSLALTTTGAVLAWGENSTGQLGTGSTANSDVPVPVDLPPGLLAHRHRQRPGHPAQPGHLRRLPADPPARPGRGPDASLP